MTALDALWEYVRAHYPQLIFDSYQHVSAVVQSVAIATVIGVAIGVLTYRNALAANLATATSSVILTVPAFALLGLLIPLFGPGSRYEGVVTLDTLIDTITRLRDRAEASTGAGDGTP